MATIFEHNQELPADEFSSQLHRYVCRMMVEYAEWDSVMPDAYKLCLPLEGEDKIVIRNYWDYTNKDPLLQQVRQETPEAIPAAYYDVLDDGRAMLDIESIDPNERVENLLLFRPVDLKTPSLLDKALRRHKIAPSLARPILFSYSGGELVAPQDNFLVTKLLQHLPRQ